MPEIPCFSYKEGISNRRISCSPPAEVNDGTFSERSTPQTCAGSTSITSFRHFSQIGLKQHSQPPYLPLFTAYISEIIIFFSREGSCQSFLIIPKDMAPIFSDWSRIYPWWSGIFSSSRPHTLRSNPSHSCGFDSTGHWCSSSLYLQAGVLSWALYH